MRLISIRGSIMQIFIPTYGRSSTQPTFHALQAAGLDPVLVVQYREHGKYHGCPVNILPNYIRTIAPTRQYILDHFVTDDTFCMVDDDLVFFKRRDDDKTKLREITPSELYNAFHNMSIMLGRTYPHAGFASREGANRNTQEWVYDTRIMRVLGYDATVLRDYEIRFDDMEVMEDFHVALQLLERGYHNVILNDYAHNQAGSGAAGGCSHFRTPELHAANAEKLATFHPRYVKVVEKTTKGAWGGGTRKDVVVQWKKAIKEATHAELF
jgi:hypothetical protein